MALSEHFYSVINNHFTLQVCVTDFAPRLTVEVNQQQLLRDEFRRVAARMGKF